MLFLAGYGVPWDVVTGWSNARRMAACVAINEEKGERFDWEAMQYIPRGN